MAKYTIQYFNRKGVAVGRKVDVACADDAAAIQWARPYSGSLRMEIRQGERLVHAFPGWGETEAAAE